MLRYRRYRNFTHLETEICLIFLFLRTHVNSQFSIDFAQLYVFARGEDNAIWYKILEDNGFSEWKSLGGVFTSEAAAAWSKPYPHLESQIHRNTAHNRIAVFARGEDNAIWYRYFRQYVFSLKEIFKAKGISPPMSIRNIVQNLTITSIPFPAPFPGPISVNELMEILA